MKTFMLVLMIGISGCSLMPSKWDQNQARVFTDITQAAKHLNCNIDIDQQVHSLNNSVDWFRTYSQYRNTEDIDKLVGTLDTTVDEFHDRVNRGQISSEYCEIKKAIIVEQVNIIGNTIAGSLP
jgi:hypothetical protein